MTFIQLLNRSCQSARKDSVCEECKLRIATSYLCWTASPETQNKTLAGFKRELQLPHGESKITSALFNDPEIKPAKAKFQPSTMQEDRNIK